MGVYRIVISVGLIGCGVLSIANLLVSRRSGSGQSMTELLKHSSYAGPIIFVAGLWGLVDGLVLSKLYSVAGAILKALPIQGFAILAFPPLSLLMGLLLGLPMVVLLVSKDRGRAESLVKQLSPFQAAFGFPSIAVGVLMLLLALKIYF